TITVQASYTDGGGTSESVTSAATGPVANLNDAPVLNASASPVVASVAEDVPEASNPGTTVADIVANGSVTDPDGPPLEAIYVSAVDNANGVWQYKLASQSSFTPITLSGAQGLLLDGTDFIRFVPAQNFAGPATLTFGAWDKSTGSAGGSPDLSNKGGTSAFSLTTDTATVTVTQVNDPPFSQGFLASVSVAANAANTTAVPLGLTDLKYGPGGGSDEQGQTLTVIVNSVPAFIQLYKADGTTAVNSGATLPLADFYGLGFKTISNQHGSGSISWTVSDNGLTNGASDSKSVTESLSVTVAAPILPTVQFSQATGSSNEGNSGSSTITVQAVLSAASTQAVTVPISYSGTASSGTDYNNAPTSITIAAG
ncbi:MAG: hypothetical protein EBU75_12875, partial [Betaproteobacteria bacterium]|nr:hypothetical protein [Betaproteobacteria bacterium]